jgi:hypothetical protein
MSMGGDLVLSGEKAMPVTIDPAGWGVSALLGRSAVVIWNDVVPEGREQFYAWHDKEHIPERLSLPGFRRGRRFVRPDHSPEWLTMYEAVDVRALVSPEYLASLNAPTPATVSTLKHFRNTSRAACRVVHSVGSSTGGHVLAMRLNGSAERGEAVCRYFRDDVFPRAMARTGVVACHLYAADSSASYVNTAESSTRDFDVPAWVVLCEASTPGAADQAREAIDDHVLMRMDVEVRKDAAVYALEICRLSVSVARREDL